MPKVVVLIATSKSCGHCSHVSELMRHGPQTLAPILAALAKSGVGVSRVLWFSYPTLNSDDARVTIQTYTPSQKANSSNAERWERADRSHVPSLITFAPFVTTFPWCALTTERDINMVVPESAGSPGVQGSLFVVVPGHETRCEAWNGQREDGSCSYKLVPEKMREIPDFSSQNLGEHRVMLFAHLLSTAVESRSGAMLFNEALRVDMKNISPAKAYGERAYSFARERSDSDSSNRSEPKRRYYRHVSFTAPTARR